MNSLWYLKGPSSHAICSDFCSNIVEILVTKTLVFAHKPSVVTLPIYVQFSSTTSSMFCREICLNCSRWLAHFSLTSNGQWFFNAIKLLSKIYKQCSILLCCRNMPTFQIRWGSKSIPGFVKKIKYLNYLHRLITRVVSNTETCIEGLYHSAWWSCVACGTVAV